MNLEITIPNILTLEALIQENLKRVTTPVPFNDPRPADIANSEEIQEALEALEFANEKYMQASDNRFSAMQLSEDGALGQAMEAINNVIMRAQRAYDDECKRIEKEFAIKDKFRGEINKLFHSRKIKKAIEDLKKATLEISDSINDIGDVRIDDVLDDDVIVFFAMQAIKKLH